MPYEWSKPAGTDTPPHVLLSAWPYRSLPRKGFVWFITITVCLISLPLMAFLGSSHWWTMLPFVGAAVVAIWYFLERSYKDGSVLEELKLWPDHMELTRHNPRQADQHWQANPYWVKINLLPKGGPVENYLTLSGGPREVELGAFLTPSERRDLHDELRVRISQLDTG